MKKVLISATLLATHIASAATPINGWYGSVFGGYAYVPNNISNTQLGLTRSNASYQSGFDAGGSFGFKSNPMRYEGELTYIDAKIDHFLVNNINQTGTTGYTNAVLAMANIYYDFPEIVCAIQPFLGVGLGYAWVNGKLYSTGPAAGGTQFTGSNGLFAYQATAGLTYNFSESYALNLGYRYVATERADQLGKSFQAHLGNIGAIYRFDGARYK